MNQKFWREAPKICVLTSPPGEPALKKVEVAATGIPRAHLGLVLSWNLSVEIFLRFFDLLSVLLINSFLVLFCLTQSEWLFAAD